MGSIISHLAWLYAAEEGVEFASQDCCFLIRDAMMAELDGMHFSRYGQPEKKSHCSRQKKASIFPETRIPLVIGDNFLTNPSIKIR